MPRDTATRRFQLTFNNPKEHDYSHEKIKSLLEAGGKIGYWCMGDEIGTQETYHTHLYVEFVNPTMIKTVQKRFYGAHIEVATWGTGEQNRAYVRKEGEQYNKQTDGHYSYVDRNGKLHEGVNYADTFEEYGEMSSGGRGHGDRNDMRLLYAMIEDGLDNATILSSHPEYLRDITTIDRVRQTILEKKYRSEFRILDVTYIYGPTGCGKSRSVREQHGYEQCYNTSDYKHPFDGYRQQPVLIFDEFRSDLRIGDMLQYLDGYPIELPARYANKQACYTTVYIISNLPLENQYVTTQIESPETWQAFLRRINRVRIFENDGSYVELSVKKYFSPFRITSVPGETKDCPF